MGLLHWLSDQSGKMGQWAVGTAMHSAKMLDAGCARHAPLRYLVTCPETRNPKQPKPKPQP